MIAKVILRIDPSIKEKASRLARREGKNLSQLIRELLEQYVKEHDMSEYIENLWNDIGRKLSEKGITQKDIEKVIREVRSSR